MKRYRIKVSHRQMNPSEALRTHREAIRRMVMQYNTQNARIFGSVLRGQDTENCELDWVIDPTPKSTLMDIAVIRYELRPAA